MKLGATFLYVTHDQVEAMSMGDKVGVLNHGRIVQIGTPYEIYNHPRDTFVATFVGSPAMNLLTAQVRVGRLVELEATDGADLDALCEKLLANPLIEDYEVEQLPDTSSAPLPGASGSDSG